MYSGTCHEINTDVKIVDSQRGKDAPLTDQRIGKSEENVLPVHKSVTWMAKVLIMVSYPCADAKSSKGTCQP